MKALSSHRRVVLAVAAVLVAGILLGLALALAKAQRDSRHTVEQRFATGPDASASLVQTIVAQAYANDAQIGEGLLAAPKLSEAALAAAAGRTGSRAVIVLDAGGQVVGAYPSGTQPGTGDDRHRRQALAGRPGLSHVLRSGGRPTIEVAVPFRARTGRRVIVIPSPVAQVQRVLGPYLANLPGLEGHRSYIVDAKGPGAAAVLAADRPRPAADRELLSTIRTAPASHDGALAGGDRRYASAAVPGTPWSVVDTVDSSVLFSPVSGWERTLPWLLLIVLLPAGAFILLLADRAGRSAERARSASEAKSAFLASMSHELRTPMTTVIGFSQMLHEGRLGELTDRQSEVVGHIHTSSKHLNQLIEEVLDLSRVEEGRMTFHPEDVQPQRLMLEVAAGMSGLAEDRGVEIDVEAPDVGTFRLDPARFKQVLYNLIGNAVKFTEAGGHVRVRLWRDEHDELAVEVTDTGAGIAPEDLDRIFLPFEQSGRDHAGGAGLGLAVSRRIIDAQGGKIGVLSHPGKGSTFTVKLPPSRR